MRGMRICLTLVTLVALALPAFAQQVGDGQFAASSNLRAGVAKIDITPDDVTGMIADGHRREVKAIRDPLRAGVLVLDDGTTKAAIVTMDVLQAWDALVPLAREKIAAASGVPAENIMITASHNHSGPPYDPLHKWGRDLVNKLGAAAKQAAANMRTVTVGYGEDEIGFGINRRKVIDGRTVVRLNPDGPNDPRVKVLRFDDGKSLTPMAVIMHAVCHPCFFTWGDKGSPPYPDGYPKIER